MQIDSSIRYLEIVTPDVAGTVAVFEKSSAVKFSDPIEALGNARTAPMAGGAQMGIRAPMSETEEPVTRTYFATDNIEVATEQAVAAGAELAHPVMEIPGQGKFSIFFHGDNQFGYWQD